LISVLCQTLAVFQLYRGITNYFKPSEESKCF